MNEKYSERIKWVPSWKTWRKRKDEQVLVYNEWGIGWQNQPGLGKWYKKRLHRAERRQIKAELKGKRGKEPTGQLSDLKWRGT